MKNWILAMSAMLISSSAFAQNYGAILGVHQTSADASIDAAGTTISINGKMGYKLGLAVSFDLVENQIFRTGLIYNKRSFEAEISAITGTYEADFSYFDIPALYQYNINEMFGLFGGLIIAFNSSDSISVPAGQTNNIDAEGLIPLLNLGGSLLFDDQIGFDFYYERGLGKIASSTTVEIKDFSTFGANFLYWF